ncbi:alginate biosynthesis protein Alg44 [Marinobacter lipolyticus SM19]|uniref:Alginate biosynthesis protein Alg44 n=1 Tax=Marinobacter lipolyticus SM19 TaxID=1318628 RepID=R8AZG6_9GAMM|nr:HlyD family efflux transporter periplasmic adaptor subunit [Marinobacter lipolyticus]EON91731.1 alginate biosynthesis protein Alg44 [Marinobacter lipolyticus SM19]
MNTAAVAPQFVHESEAQRQYARVKIPAKLFMNLDGTTQKFPVADVSAGGFSVNTGLESLRQRRLYNGRLVFKVDGFDFAVDVNFVPRSFDPASDRCGCEFQDLGAREVSVLRYLITAFLSGEVVSAGDVLNTLSRENFTKARKSKGSNDLGFFGKVRAMFGSLVVMLAGLSAISFVASELWDIYFVTKAESAMVASEQIPVRIPKDAKVTTLVKPGQEVKAGETIATFDAPMMSYVNDLVGEGSYSVGQIEELLDQRVRGTLTSPCDCKVVNLRPAENQYMSKGEQLAVMAPMDSSAHIIANFQFDQGEKLEEGQQVTLRLPNGREQAGRITSLYVNSQAQGGPIDVISASIESAEPLPIEAIGRPIGVRVDQFRMPSLQKVVDRFSES